MTPRRRFPGPCPLPIPPALAGEGGAAGAGATAGALLAFSSNDAINFFSAPTAFAAPSPDATSVTSSPRCAPNDMSATALFAFALRPLAEIVISAADVLAKFAISAAGRA